MDIKPYPAFILSLCFLFVAAFAQSADQQRFATPADAGQFLSEKRETLSELRGQFTSADDTLLDDLRTRADQERAEIDGLLKQLEDEQSRLSLPGQQTGNAADPDTDTSSNGAPADESNTDVPPSSATDNTERDRLKSSIASVEALRQRYDSLLADIAERRYLAELQSDVDAQRAEIEAAIVRFDNAPDEVALIELREELRRLRADAAGPMEALRVTRDRLATDIERLGPVPENSDVPEAEEITAERAKLRLALAKEDAIIRQAELNEADIARLLTDIAKKRRDQFYDQIFSRGPIPVLPNVLGAAAASAQLSLQTLQAKSEAWHVARQERGGIAVPLSLIGLSVGFALVLFFPARRWVNRRIIDRLQSLEPTPSLRTWAAIARIAARAVPGVIGGLIIIETLRATGVIDSTTDNFARSVWVGGLALIVGEAAATAILSPSVPGWRLMPLDQKSGTALKVIVLLALGVFFADRSVSVAVTIYGGNQEFALVQSAVTTFLLGIFLIIVGQKFVWKLEDNRQGVFSDETKGAGTNIRRTAPILGVAVIVASLIGFVSLGHFAATRIVMVAGLIVPSIFLRVIIHEALRALDRRFNGGKKTTETETDNEQLIFFWIGAFVDLIILTAILPIVAIALGAEVADVRDFAAQAFFGFKIGNITISFAQIFGAVFTFVVILAVTRFIQRTGEKRFFPRTRLDIGVQNSLKTMIGYIGLIIAVMSGISVLGFNLSNLAIIAGALSVGIGFGLQSIVNNFVSGLILLFERPIKVGDWIVVSSGEGTVKRISVRSTEIETWDRSSIIVPNSELISSSVTNWTHKDRWTRLIVPVGVSYESDPDEVVTVLNKVITSNKRIMKNPAPVVFFSGFGDSSLDFEVRVFLRDTTDRIPAYTELRIAIFKALKEADIEIPFPQRDLHLRSADSDIWRRTDQPADLPSSPETEPLKSSQAAAE